MYKISDILKIPDLFLRSKIILKGFLSGIHSVPFKGFSAEFSQYRQYSVGDDFQKIDWKAFMRTEKFYIKECENETNTDIFILLDISKSMEFKKKFEYAKTIMFIISYIGLRQGDNVGYAFFSDDVKYMRMPSKRNRLLYDIAAELENISAEGKSEILKIYMNLSERIKKNTFVIIITDCAVNKNDLIKTLSSFKVKGCDVILFQVNDENEFSRSILDNTKLYDEETGGILNNYGYSSRKNEIEKYFDDIKNECSERSIEYVHITTANNFNDVLYGFFNRRRK